MTAGPSQREQVDSTVEDSATVAKWTLMSRITGFLRVVAIAGVLGPTYLGNLFQTVNVLPWIIFDLAIGSLLTSILVPGLVAADRVGPEEFSNAASSLFKAVAALFVAITALLMVIAPLTARLLALGLQGDAPKNDYLDAALPLLVLTAPQVLGYGLIAFAEAVQNARGRFALPAAAPAIENFVVVSALMLFALLYGTGVTTGEITSGGLLLLGIGSSLGVLTHLLVQLFGVRLVGAGIRLRAPRHQSVSDAIVMAKPASLAAVMNSVRLFLPLIITGAVPGGTVAYQMAQNVLGVPTALGARSISVAFVPRASQLAIARRWREFSSEYLSAQSVVLLIAVPAAAALLATAPWLADALAIGAMDTVGGPTLLLASLPSIAGAVIGLAVIQVAIATSISRNRSTIAATASAVRLAVTLIGLYVAWVWFDGTALLVVVGVTISLADLTGALVSWKDPLRGLDVPLDPASIVPSPVRTLVAAAIVFLPLGLVAWFSGIGVGRAPIATGIVGAIGLASVAVFSLIRWRLEPAAISRVARQFRGTESDAGTAVLVP